MVEMEEKQKRVEVCPNIAVIASVNGFIYLIRLQIGFLNIY